MVNCMVKSCTSRGKMPGITYHQIPKKNPIPWFDALKRLPFEYVTHRNVVCSRHFKHDDFSDGIHIYLKPGAVPSQNLDDGDGYENFDFVTQCQIETPSELDFSGKFDFISLCKEKTPFEVDNTPGSTAVKESFTENIEEDPLYLKPSEVPSVNAEEICGDNVNIPYNTFCDNITTVTSSTILQPLLMQVPANISFCIITNNTSSHYTGTSILEEQSDGNKKIIKEKLKDCTKHAFIKDGLQDTQISTSSTDDPELQKKIVEEYHKYSLTPTKHEKLTVKQTATSIKKKVKAAQRRYRRLERNVLRLKVIVEKLKQKHVCHD